MALPSSPTGLYWSLRGEVACIDHVPTDPAQQKGNGWQPIPITYRGTFQCQHCSPDRKALADSEAHASADG